MSVIFFLRVRGRSQGPSRSNEHVMASSRRLLVVPALLAVLAAGACATGADPGATPTSPGSATSTGGASTGPATTAPEPAGGATISIPDLSTAEIDCASVAEPCEPGEDPELDRLWQACEGGEGRACDRLYYDAPFDTRYEQFGNTCGDRGQVVPCAEQLP